MIIISLWIMPRFIKLFINKKDFINQSIRFMLARTRHPLIVSSKSFLNLKNKLLGIELS